MIRYRKAAVSDIPDLARIRKIQLQDEGQSPETDMDKELIGYFEDRMSSGDLVEWVAEDKHGEIIATAAIVFMDFPPAFTNPTGRKGYIANMYTADRYRGQGIATDLIKKLEQEARNRGITKLVLHASEMGRKVYARIAFAETDVVMEKDMD